MISPKPRGKKTCSSSYSSVLQPTESFATVSAGGPNGVRDGICAGGEPVTVTNFVQIDHDMSLYVLGWFRELGLETFAELLTSGLIEAKRLLKLSRGWSEAAVPRWPRQQGHVVGGLLRPLPAGPDAQSTRPLPTGQPAPSDTDHRSAHTLTSGPRAVRAPRVSVS